MQIVIHRGTHQIGGVATEIRTERTRILIDMGDELSLDPDFQPAPLHIPGVTNSDGECDAVLFTHNHGDHVGQLKNIRNGIPLYMGGLAKDVLLTSIQDALPETVARIRDANTYTPGQTIVIGDISVTPLSIDHSACDSYMLLIEAEGKRILHTGDFRAHGFRGKSLEKLLQYRIQKVDVLITEGTTLSRNATLPMTERELQQKVKSYMEQYKYVFVCCASTNLERICAMSKAVPTGKFFICDGRQSKLLNLIQTHWGQYSPLYRDIKKTVYGDNLLERFRDKGFLMMVRDNQKFRQIIPQFAPEESIMLYSMWDGYRTRPGSTMQSFLELTGKWEALHTSGHASSEAIQKLIEGCDPSIVIPIHTDKPDALTDLCPTRTVALLQDGEIMQI